MELSDQIRTFSHYFSKEIAPIESGKLDKLDKLDKTDIIFNEEINRNIQFIQNIQNIQFSTYDKRVISEYIGSKNSLQEKTIAAYSIHKELTDEELSTILGVKKQQTSVIRKKDSIEQYIIIIEGKTSDRQASYGLIPIKNEEEKILLHEWAEQRLLGLEQQKKNLIKQKNDAAISLIKFGGSLRDDIEKQFNEGNYSIKLDVQELARFSPELADVLLEQPEDTIKAAQMSFKNWEGIVTETICAQVEIRPFNLPASNKIRLGTMRATQIGKLFESTIEIVTRSLVDPQVISARFECPSCGNVLPVLQLEQKFKEPSRCGCGRKGKFRLLSKETKDSCLLRVKQPLEETIGMSGTPEVRAALILGDDLTEKDLIDQIGAGVQATIVYIPKELPIILPRGGQSIRYNIMLDIHHIIPTKDYTFNLDFTKEEIENFHAEVKKPGFLEELCACMYPAHYGDDELKMVLAAQLVAGSFTRRRAEENLHVLIFGDPGTGKTENLILRSVALAPRAWFSEGTQATSAPGLIGSMRQDKETNMWIADPGSMPANHRGLLAIDELNVMDKDIQPVINQPLASGTCSLNKAGHKITQQCDIRMLSGANPKDARFENGIVTKDSLSAINPALRDRFFMYFLPDTVDRFRDEQVARKILGREKNLTKKRTYSDSFIRDFIIYARSTVIPIMRAEEKVEIINFYVRLREQTKNNAPYPIGPRLLMIFGSLVLLFAKLHLRSETNNEDLHNAWCILQKMLVPLGFDSLTLTTVLPRIGPLQTSREGERAEKTGFVVFKKGSTEEDVLLEISGHQLKNKEPLPESVLEKERFVSGFKEWLATAKNNGLLFSPKPGFVAMLD